MSDQYVYVKSKKFSWIPALLVDHSKDTATVIIVDYKTEEEILHNVNVDYTPNTKKITVKLKDYPNQALPLQNVFKSPESMKNKGKLNVMQDMISLQFLHEAAILYNLKARHIAQQPYTRTGDIIIAVNPYQWIPKLYTPQQRQYYTNSIVFENSKETHNTDYNRDGLPPHVYETSALSFKGLTSSHGCETQSILISGESGAGKTETVKICLKHIASMQQINGTIKNEANNQDHVVTKILDSNPLLEAFGNAKTRRNDNSSRFGKYIQLQFDCDSNHSSTQLIGSTVEVYLLEKSRIVNFDDEEERTFHIFYQLLSAPKSVQSDYWELLPNKKYFTYMRKHYKNGCIETHDTEIDGMSDEQHFEATLQQLAVIGIQGDELKTLMQALCIVLQLGNITFESTNASHLQNNGSSDSSKKSILSPPLHEDGTVITSPQELNELADLLGIAVSTLEQTFLERKLRVRGEVQDVRVPLSPEVARESCDALAKRIYKGTFDWLVKSINEATKAKPVKDAASLVGSVGLLDIFGFESFPINGLEQLCINYANEKLQAKFTKDVFQSVMEEYISEGIGIDDIMYNDNSNVLELIEHKKIGLIVLLNEECIRPNGHDGGFVNKALHANAKSTALINPRIKHTNLEFGIRHYAGDVIYTATDFVAKNQDTIPQDLIECAQASTNSIIAKEVAPPPEAEDPPSTDASMHSSSLHGSSLHGSSLHGSSLHGASSLSSSLHGSSSHHGPPLASPRTPRRMKRKSNLVAPTAWTKYKSQLFLLMRQLESSKCRYIRCIKPNTNKRPKIMTHQMTLEQLQSSGVISAVTLSRSSFPNRMGHKECLMRFQCLWTRQYNNLSLSRKVMDSMTSSEIKRHVNELLECVLKSKETTDDFDNVTQAFVIGQTRVYFRAGALEFLETERLIGMEPKVINIQRIARGCITRRRVRAMKYEMIREQNEAAIMIECCWRMFQSKKVFKVKRRERKLFLKRQREQQLKRNAAIVIQCCVRVYFAKRRRDKKYAKYLKEQAKKLKREKKLRKQTRAAVRIQKYARRFIIKIRFAEALVKARERAKLAAQVARLKRKIAKAEKARKKELKAIEASMAEQEKGRLAWQQEVKAAADAAAQNEVLHMMQFLQNENRKLQVKQKTLEGKIKPLKKNFDKVMQENQELRKEFEEIQEKNENMRKQNTELVEKRKTMEADTVKLKAELKTVSNQFLPLAHGRLDFQKALKEIMDTVEVKCSDSQLLEDVTMLSFQCQAEAKGLQAGAVAAEEAVSRPSTPTRSRRGNVGAKLKSLGQSTSALPLGKLSLLNDDNNNINNNSNHSINNNTLEPTTPKRGKKKAMRSQSVLLSPKYSKFSERDLITPVTQAKPKFPVPMSATSSAGVSTTPTSGRPRRSGSIVRKSAVLESLGKLEL